MRVLFLVPYPIGEAPSQRFRFEQYFEIMRQAGICSDVSSFLDVETWRVLYKKGYVAAKLFGIFRGFMQRLKDLASVSKYDYVFIHREAAPLGPPVLEWLIAKVFHKKIIYDFDDAIWLPNVSDSNKLFSKLKWYHKVRSICRWAYLISCGNEYLKDFAAQFNNNVAVNPTIVNTESHYNKIKEHHPGKTIIGWTGTHSTVRYLNSLLPVLKQIENELEVEIRIISNARPQLPLKTLKFIPWKKDTEIEDLLSFDIGIMPLPDDEWAKGKCGFKLIQYMALGIPPVSSPNGVNSSIVQHGINGYLCRTDSDWKNSLNDLIKDHKKRNQFGEKGRKQIVKNYSVAGNAPLFLRMFA